MKLAVFFVSISSFCVVCGLCGGDLKASTPRHPPTPGSLTPDSPPRDCTAAETGRAGWHVGRKRKRGERHLRWMINAKKTRFTVRDSRRSFCQCFIAERELSHTRPIAADDRNFSTSLFYPVGSFFLCFFFCLFLIRDAVLKKAKTSSYELLLCTALSQQLLSFSTRDQPCNQKLLWSRFDFSVSGFLLTCHV